MKPYRDIHVNLQNTGNLDTLIIKPRDKAGLNFFLELAKRPGWNQDRNH